ncbi:hypothetical protein FACS1894199_07010 [Bacteroidia bacterium]|nr:hypothetical protein FACS1894199_07010 [Bacteroidia bacterium]
MKKIKYYLATAIVLAIGMSCSDKEADTETANSSRNGLTPVKFSTQSLVTKTSTTGNVTTWTAGDNVGIYAFETGSAIGSGALNKQYSAATSAATTTFTPVDAEQTVYYPEEGNVDFVAYYPYKSTISDGYGYPIDVSDQSNQGALDMLWSNNATNVAESTNAVNLQFEHQLAKLVLHVNKGTELALADFSAMTVQFDGFTTTASLNLADGTLSSGTATPFNALKLPTVTGDDATFEATLIPTSSTTGSRVIFTSEGKKYVWDDLPASIQQGKVYSYIITIEENTVVAVAVNSFEGDIDNWTSQTQYNDTTKEVKLVKLSKAGWTVTVSGGTGDEFILDDDLTIANYWVVNDVAWIIIDMQAPVEVSKIVTVRGRQWGNSHTKTLKYFIGDTDDPDGTWTSIATGAYPGEGGSGVLADETLSLTVASGTGRYLKLLLDDSIWQQYHQICEIDVWVYE